MKSIVKNILKGDYMKKLNILVVAACASVGMQSLAEWGRVENRSASTWAEFVTTSAGTQFSGIGNYLGETEPRKLKDINFDNGNFIIKPLGKYKGWIGLPASNAGALASSVKLFLYPKGDVLNPIIFYLDVSVDTNSVRAVKIDRSGVVLDVSGPSAKNVRDKTIVINDTSVNFE